MPELKPPIGLLGGTFDPIHKGHLTLAEQILEKTDIKTIQFIPNANPPHRDQPSANPEHRLAMLRLAIATMPQISLNLIEFNRPGPSYMVDTLQQLQLDYSNHPLCLIIGNDVFEKFEQWHRYAEILKFCHLIIINRPSNIISKNQKIQHQLLKKYLTTDFKKLHQNLSGYIFQLDTQIINISATQIRTDISKGIYNKNHLTAEVLAYIQEKDLYTECG